MPSTVLNKFSIPPLFNRLELLTSANKAECFAYKFPLNSNLDSSGVYLPIIE